MTVLYAEPLGARMTELRRVDLYELDIKRSKNDELSGIAASIFQRVYYRLELRTINQGENSDFLVTGIQRKSRPGPESVVQYIECLTTPPSSHSRGLIPNNPNEAGML